MSWLHKAGLKASRDLESCSMSVTLALATRPLLTVHRPNGHRTSQKEVGEVRDLLLSEALQFRFPLLTNQTRTVKSLSSLASFLPKPASFLRCFSILLILSFSRNHFSFLGFRLLFCKSKQVDSMSFKVNVGSV